MNRALWVVQVLLALLFLFTGTSKLLMSPEQLTAGSPLSADFLRFISVCEILGAFGLILPGLLKIRPGLTPLAALGLLVIVTGATVVTLMTMAWTWAILPFVTAILTAFVAYGRWKLAPQKTGG
ncbi:MAG TPA: DoxX family protein [Gemmatimonadota bacterium]|jgi:hypothetical protein|nr:DoxX family protein [Gemmatimonadota bacterium]